MWPAYRRHVIIPLCKSNFQLVVFISELLQLLLLRSAAVVGLAHSIGGVILWDRHALTQLHAAVNLYKLCLDTSRYKHPCSRAAQGLTFKILLHRSRVPRPIEYTCQVSSMSVQQSRSFRVRKMLTRHRCTVSAQYVRPSHLRCRWTNDMELVPKQFAWAGHANWLFSLYTEDVSFWSVLGTLSALDIWPVLLVRSAERDDQ